MLSTCPHCLSQVNHADHLYDVTCECGAHFSPYLNVEDPKSGSFSDYAESSNAFKDIVQFGENIGTAMETPIEPLIETVQTPASEPSIKNVPKASSSSKEMLITTAAELSGYVIQNHLAPVSVVAPFQASQNNPVQMAVQNLWKMAEGQGANGIVGLQTQITPDGQNLLLIGIPVRCSKVV